MSNLTNTYEEVITNLAIAGTALSDTATGAVISTAAQAGILPIGFFSGYGTGNKLIRCTGIGIISTSASGPATLSFSVQADTTLGTRNTSGELATSTAVAPAVSLASSVFTIQSWSTVQSYSTTSAEIVSFGQLTIGGASGAAGAAYTFGSATPVALASAYSTEFFIELWAVWGTAVSGCTLTLEQWIVEGCN
jgi:hypothetical protein